MTDSDRPIEERMLATLEAILATQRETLAEYRRINAQVAEEMQRSLVLQNEAAERGKQVLKTTRSMAMLYRLLILSLFVAIGALIYVFWH